MRIKPQKTKLVHYFINVKEPGVNHENEILNAPEILSKFQWGDSICRSSIFNIKLKKIQHSRHQSYLHTHTYFINFPYTIIVETRRLSYFTDILKISLRLLSFWWYTYAHAFSRFFFRSLSILKTVPLLAL